MAGCSGFLNERITQTKLIIIAYEDAILSLTGAGAIEEYTLNTGQSIQKVTRSNLKELNTSLDGLYNRYSTLCARQNNQNGVASDSVVMVQPAW